MGGRGPGHGRGGRRRCPWAGVRIPAGTEQQHGGQRHHSDQPRSARRARSAHAPTPGPVSRNGPPGKHSVTRGGRRAPVGKMRAPSVMCRARTRAWRRSEWEMPHRRPNAVRAERRRLPRGVPVRRIRGVSARTRAAVRRVEAEYRWPEVVRTPCEDMNLTHRHRSPIPDHRFPKDGHRLRSAIKGTGHGVTGHPVTVRGSAEAAPGRAPAGTTATGSPAGPARRIREPTDPAAASPGPTPAASARLRGAPEPECHHAPQ